MKQKTVKVENKDLKSGFMLINECDFDEKLHKKYSEQKPEKKAKRAKKEPDKSE